MVPQTQSASTEETLAQIELAMEHDRTHDSIRGIATIFWGLILAKCFLAQWAVFAYNIPINALIFIWIPSLTFGALCTFIYASVVLKRITNRSLAGRFVRHIWGATLVLIAATTLLGAGLNLFDPMLLPGFFALIVGASFYIHSALNNRLLFKWTAVGWWTGSAWLFYNADENALGIFSLMILCFQVIPAVYLYYLSNTTSASSTS